jgi:hypothetical protein
VSFVLNIHGYGAKTNFMLFEVMSTELKGRAAFKEHAH